MAWYGMVEVCEGAPVELKRHDPASQRVNTTPLQATDSAILAGLVAPVLTMGGGVCYPPHGWEPGCVFGLDFIGHLLSSIIIVKFQFGPGLITVTNMG